MVWKHENIAQREKSSLVASYYGCSLSWGKQLKISSALHWDKQVISSNLFLLRGGFALSFVGSTAQAGLLRPLLADSSLDALTCTLSQDLGSSLYSAHGPATFMSTVVYHPENAMHCCRVSHLHVHSGVPSRECCALL